MSTPSSFASLVDKFRAAGKDDEQSYTWVAAQFGISRQHLYNLMKGLQKAGPDVTARIAKKMKLTERTVNSAMTVAQMVGRAS